jgi:hypothetical protein
MKFTFSLLIRNPAPSYAQQPQYPYSYSNETSAGSMVEQVFPFVGNNMTSAYEIDYDEINWHNIIYVKRHPVVKTMQLVFAVFGLIESLFYFYLSYSVCTLWTEHAVNIFMIKN